MSKVSKSAGFSKGTTLEKLKRFHKIAEIHPRVVFNVMNKRRWAYEDYYFYFDFYAGPGIYDGKRSLPELDKQRGSPFLFLDQMKDAGIGDCKFFFNDANEEVAAQLQKNLRLAGYGTEEDPVDVDCMLCKDAVDSYIKTEVQQSRRGKLLGKLGLALFDPPGVPDWSAITRFALADQFSMIDILINIPTSISKLLVVSSSPRHAKYTKRLSEHLKGLGKDHMYLWAPGAIDKHMKWVQAYCTNGPFREIKDMGFYSIEKPAGKAIAEIIDFSNEERENQSQQQSPP